MRLFKTLIIPAFITLLSILTMVVSLYISDTTCHEYGCSSSSWGFPLKFVEDLKSGSIIGELGLEDKIIASHTLFNFIFYIAIYSFLFFLVMRMKAKNRTT